MKVQCACGAKVAFDVTPEMAGRAVQFVCPQCGLDSSDRVNHLVRQELARLGASAGEPASPPVPVAAPARAPVRVRLPAEPESHPAPEVPDPSSVAAPRRVDAPNPCPRHPGQLATERCRVCSKPICPKCMELFGYVCSPRCRGKAEAQSLEVPVYAGRRSVIEARRWRTTLRATAVAAVILVLALGFWFWYAWIGGQPKVVYTAAFAQPAYSGNSALAGPDQLVLLHGATLARHDLKQKQEVWSRPLIDEKAIDAALAEMLKEKRAAIDKALAKNPDLELKMPDAAKLRQSLGREAEAELQLRVQGKNVWVFSPGKLTRYDWDTGNVAKEITLPAGAGGLIPCGNELLQLEAGSESSTLTHINLNTCESRTEALTAPAPAATNDLGAAAALAKAASRRPPAKAGLPVGMPGRDAGKTMDPAKVADQAQHMSLPARIALPAVLANARNQERLLAEANGQADGKPAPDDTIRPLGDDLVLVPTKEGVVQMSVRLLEQRITTRTAMTPPPAKSAIDGNLTVASSADAANETLNQMQRERGGEVEHVDESRYAVTLRRTDGSEPWTAEVIGRPTLYPLKTVNVLAAGKDAIVLDKANKKLWQANLNFNIPERLNTADEDASTCGQGPCVEYKDSLYLFDQGVLTAFDLATGNVRWRLPSVGIAGLFFDDHGMMYVNTTSASLDALRYSNEIDVLRKDANLVLKLDPRTGKTIWKAEPGGLVNYVSGKFIYVVYKYAADEDESAPGGYTTDSIAGRQDTLSIKRLNPGNGHIMWEYGEDRYPRDIRFDKNSIRLVLKKRVEVLRFFSF